MSLPLNEIVGLKPGRETIEKSSVCDGLEMDLVTHDAKKFFELMLKKNGYVLEQVLSPLVVHETPEYFELVAIAADCVTKHHAHHYLGFAETQWKLFQKADPTHVKPLLYVYRVLLTGIHLMRTGEVEANLVRLNETAKLPYIAELIERKTSGGEHVRLGQADFAFHQREYERLRTELQAAFEHSELPETPRGADALNDLLVRCRLKQVENWRRGLIGQFAGTICNVYRYPTLYVASDAEPHAMECVLWAMHMTWSRLAGQDRQFAQAYNAVGENEGCGRDFHRHFCERHPEAAAKEAMDYVLTCWKRVSVLLGICDEHDRNG